MASGASASGENAIPVASRSVDVILGPISVSRANAMLGEITPKMAEAVKSGPALKHFPPLARERAMPAEVGDEPLPHLVHKLVHLVLKEVLPDV